MIDDGNKGDGEQPDPRQQAAEGGESKPEWKVAGSTGARGSYAYRPGRVVVARSALARDDDLIARVQDRLGTPVSASSIGKLRTVVVLESADDDVPLDVPRTIAALRAEGVKARPDHVFFATPGNSVSSAPVMFGGVSGSPVMFGGVGGAPVMFGGVGGAPVMFGGVGGAPVMFGGAGGHGCGCCCGSPSIPSAPDAPRRSTVRRADPPPDFDADATLPPPDPGCRVVVVDTGLAEGVLVPAGLGVQPLAGTRDKPDPNSDTELDPATGHGTFIASIVRQMAPSATVEVRQILTTFGDASDSDVATALLELVADPPAIVNLSFAGYSDDDTTPPAIAEAIAELLALGVVVIAAAGNDGTCRPAWPAATDGVIGVGALDDFGPAWFTNHGHWVQACAPGVDVLGRFFNYAALDSASDPTLARPTGGPDAALQPDDSGWARWSGTSFAAPIVAGVLARRITDGAAPASAVRAVVEDPDLFRIHGLGTVVNARPW